jgi:hypothetical protein
LFDFHDVLSWDEDYYTVTAHKALGGGLRISKALVKGAYQGLGGFFPRIQAVSKTIN